MKTNICTVKTEYTIKKIELNFCYFPQLGTFTGF